MEKDQKVLTLTLELPETVSDEDGIKLAIESAGLLNNLHRSIGGNGLKLVDVKAETLIKN